MFSWLGVVRLYLLLAPLVAGAPETGPHCTPERVPACREVEVTCTPRETGVAGDWRYAWDFGDGGPVVTGRTATRLLPAGLTSYAVELSAARQGEHRHARTVLPLDTATLSDCSDAPPETPALPARPSGDGALRVAVISDSNGRYGQITQAHGSAPAVRALVEDLRPDVVVHNGDMIAAQRRGIGVEQLEAMWREYERVVVAPLRAAGIPLLPVSGNHDASPSRKLEDRAVYERVWRQPGFRPDVEYVDDENYPLRYAAVVGGALLVVLDAATGRQGHDDVRWLEEVLARVGDRGPRLVFAHVPPWQPTERGYGQLQRWPELAAILRVEKVDMLLSGHYEVFYPARLDGVEVVLDGTLAMNCGKRKDDREGCRCRPLAGTTVCQGMTFVVLDAAGGRLKRRFAVAGPDFDRVFPSARLPEMVNGSRRAPGWL